MTQFGREATNADAALFFYAGHAIQYQGRNYLLPVDADLEDEVSLRFQTTSLDDVRAAVERASGVKIMILDACRNNPIVDTLKRRMMGMNRGLDLTRGLARIDRAEGIIVAYATAADEVAADGQGRNSPFSAALIKRLQEPGLEIAKMFRRIAADVVETTHGRQRPEIYVSLIDEYYINQKDRAAWDQIKDKNDPKAFRDFVTSYPSSPRVSDAQYRLDMLERLSRERQAEKERLEQDAVKARLADAERQAAEAAKQEASSGTGRQGSRQTRGARQEATKRGRATGSSTAGSRETSGGRQAGSGTATGTPRKPPSRRQRGSKPPRRPHGRKQHDRKRRNKKRPPSRKRRGNRQPRKLRDRKLSKQQAAKEAARQEAAKQEETAKREAARLAMLERDKTERETAEREAAQRRHDEEQARKGRGCGARKASALDNRPGATTNIGTQDAAGSIARADLQTRRRAADEAASQPGQRRYRPLRAANSAVRSCGRKSRACAKA